MSGRRARCGISKIASDWWTRAERRRHRADRRACPPPRAPAAKWGAPASSLNEETHQKKIIFHPKMMPGIVIADPELTVGLPPKITAATGIDALSHIFEAFCAPVPSSAGRRRRARRHAAHQDLSAVAVQDGSDIEARSRMLAASAWARRRSRKASAPCTPEPSVLGQSQHASRADQCRRHALCARVEPQRARRKDGAPGRLPGPAAAVLRWRAELDPGVAPARSAFPLRWPIWACRPAHADTFAQQAFDDPSTGGNPLPMTPDEVRAAVSELHRRPAVGGWLNLASFIGNSCPPQAY